MELNLKDALPLIGTVVGAILGWFLNQFGQWFVVRREEKRAIGRAVADLLEIRLRLLALPRAVEVLSKKFSIPPEGQTVLKVALAQLFPADADMGKRYGEAVTLVAAANPLLGFRLRSQDVVTPLLHQLRTIALGDMATIAAYAHFEKTLLEHLQPHLDRLIRETAWAHGVLTWAKAQRVLRRPLEIPDGLLESLTARMPKGGEASPEIGTTEGTK